MCLAKIKRYKSKPRYGYKCFSLNNNDELIPEYMPSYDANLNPIIYKRNQIYETKLASDGIPYINKSGTRKYKAGFHCFTTLKAAKEWRNGEKDLVIYKVKINNIVAQGEQSVGCSWENYNKRHRVVVAQKMQLIKKIL